MRRSIGLVIAAGLLPIIALSGAFGIITLSSERAAVRNGADSASRFIATLASVKLTDGMHEVNMIAQSPAFDGPVDVARFRMLAVRLRNSQANWRFLSVADPSGRRLLDVPGPIGGQEGGPVIDMASFKEAVASRKPVVGNVVRGPQGNYAFAVRAPVIRDGQVRYVLSAVIPAQAATGLLRVRGLPTGWRAGIIDGNGNVVANTVPDSKSIGQPASLAGRTAKQSGKPGFYDVTRSDGSPAIATWQPIPGTKWSTHISAPVAAYATATTNAWTLLAIVAILCLALLAVLVRLLAYELGQLRARDAAVVQRQRLEALGRLTGGVAHDFNNLLQPVMGGLDLLARRVKDDEKAQSYIALAMAGAERARALVARLLAFSRQQPLASTPVDIGRMLTDIEHLLERSISPVARLEVNVPSDLPPVRADAGQLELAILNLAINARDAMPDGGTVGIGAAIMEISKAGDLANGRYVAITVSDTGTGMDEATMRQAIDPFFTTKSADKGTGLGLSMVHGFAVQSGGALRLSSTQGVGTKATVIMPLATDQSPLPSPVDHKEAKGEARILLVDDDGQVRRAVAEMLRESGHDVIEAASVDAALGLLADAEVDLVVTDYLMPERSGGQLIQELSTRAPSLPVLMITGYDNITGDVPDSVPRLVKPFRADELLAKVQGLLNGRRSLIDA